MLSKSENIFQIILNLFFMLISLSEKIPQAVIIWLNDWQWFTLAACALTSNSLDNMLGESHRSM